MTRMIGFVSAKGSPGVTTSTLAIGSVWPDPVLVVEADPAGGDVRAGLGGGEWPEAHGLTDLVADLRTSPITAALDQRVHVAGSHAPAVLAGLGSIAQAGHLPWERLAHEFAHLQGCDVLVDLGRFLPGPIWPLVAACDQLVMVTGTSLRATRSAARLAPLLSGRLGTDRVGVLVVGAGEPYGASEVAAQCGAPLVGELRRDPRAAAVWSEGATPWRRFDRSGLQRDAATVADALSARTTAPVGAS